MKAGFRGWLFRWISAAFGLVGVAVGLSLLELSRLYGFRDLGGTAGIVLGIAFLLLMSSLLGEWSWKRYAVACLVTASIFVLPYLALRPEMFRDDVRKQLTNPPLTVDLLYRGLALRRDPERDLKIERLQFVYGLVNGYGKKE